MKIIRPTPVTGAMLTSSSISENDYAAWSGATTYAAGVRVIMTSTHKIYESLQAGNLNHDPSTEAATPVWWIEVSSTNRWRMFDDSPSLQSSAADSITVRITPGSRINSIALLNLSAASAHIVMTDPTDGVVYDDTLVLTSDSGITDWYAYFFEPIIRKTDVALTDLPPYSSAYLDVTITDTGSNAAVGECVIGMFRDLGSTKYGAQLGIQDYSVKQRDDFGNYTILERAFNKRAVFDFWLDRTKTSTVHSILAEHRATPAVYIGDDDTDAAIIYGFYKDFSIEIAYKTVSLCSVEIEGLT